MTLSQVELFITAVVGLLAYALSPNAKIGEVGRIVFAAATLVLLLILGRVR